MNKANRFQDLQERISGDKKEHNILDSWHYLMIHYGWISFEEFKKMDANLVGELIERLNKMNEEQNRQGKGK